MQCRSSTRRNQLQVTPVSPACSAPPASAPTSIPRSLQWQGDESGYLRMLDQTQLPTQTVWLDCRTVDQVDEAIRQLRVRGAPAIGIAAAYGVCLAAQAELAPPELSVQVQHAINQLAASRPTAVNLFWALDRMRQVHSQHPQTETDFGMSLRQALLREAKAIHQEDCEMCHAIGRHGATLLPDGCGILTHCNAGGLATAEYGTALAAIFTAQDQGKQLHVFADETRPLLQGSRLTAWELKQRGVPCTLICDSMAAQVMKEKRVQAVIVGADRITARGDTANKIGTYGLAILAKHHGIPFYVAAPSSTFDLTIEDGEAIEIEQRKPSEITEGFGKRTAPDGIGVYNPAFDVTPAELITAIITENGIISPVTSSEIVRLVKQKTD